MLLFTIVHCSTAFRLTVLRPLLCYKVKPSNVNADPPFASIVIVLVLVTLLPSLCCLLALLELQLLV
jgi:hypothetical protein